jgi:hypothetical protein
MRSIRKKTLPTRLVATVMMVALILATMIGAYGHAAGHAHHSALCATHQPTSDTHAGPNVSEPGHVNSEHESTDKGQAHSNCYDLLCHGGFAVLCQAADMPPAPQSVPVIPPHAGVSNMWCGGLERPPRSPVLA